MNDEENKKIWLIFIPGFGGVKLDNYPPKNIFYKLLCNKKLLTNKDVREMYNSDPIEILEEMVVCYPFKRKILYKKFIKMLQSIREMDPRLIVLDFFIYNFMRPNEDTGIYELARFVADGLASTDFKKIILVNHSMGGIVARVFCELTNITEHLDDDVLVNICISTPHAGIKEILPFYWPTDIPPDYNVLPKSKWNRSLKKIKRFTRDDETTRLFVDRCKSLRELLTGESQRILNRLHGGVIYNENLLTKLNTTAGRVEGVKSIFIQPHPIDGFFKRNPADAVCGGDGTVDNCANPNTSLLATNFRDGVSSQQQHTQQQQDQEFTDMHTEILRNDACIAAIREIILDEMFPQNRTAGVNLVKYVKSRDPVKNYKMIRKDGPDFESLTYELNTRINENTHCIPLKGNNNDNNIINPSMAIYNAGGSDVSFVPTDEPPVVLTASVTCIVQGDRNNKDRHITVTKHLPEEKYSK